MPDSFFVTRLLPVLLTSYQSSGVIMPAALVEFWFQCLDFPQFEWRHHASLIFRNWVVSSGLTSYGLSGAVIPSSCLELDCFQWCDFMLVEWHCLAHSHFFWKSDCFRLWWLDFLWFEWSNHDILILEFDCLQWLWLPTLRVAPSCLSHFLELHCFRCFDFLQF